MTKITGTLKVEIQIFVAIFFVAILNIIIFKNLSVGDSNPIRNALAGSLNMIIIYGISILGSLFCIIFKKTHLLKDIFYTLLLVMLLHIGTNLYFLIINPVISNNGKAILSDALMIWTASLLVFSLWYWAIDRGGPVARATDDNETRYDLLFPQYQSKIPGWYSWKPKFLDYLFFSFFTSTGFSPADTLPLTKRVKLLMMIEAFISLVIIGMVASRAISLIQ